MPTVQERLATIEAKQDYIIKQLDLVVTNNLPHIYRRLEAMEQCNAVNRSWTRFSKPIITGIIISLASVLATYYWLKVC